MTNDDVRNEKLKHYYDSEFKPEYASRNTDSLNTSDIFNGLTSTTTLALQHDFIANSPYPLGEKKLTDLKNSSDYARLHNKYHGSINHFLTQFEYYDIFIADIETGDIVYSVFKELDFGTSLLTGPYASTGIGEAFKQAQQASNQDVTYITDFNNYLPSYNDSASFIASPIYDNGRKIAVLIFQMPISRLNQLMTQQQKMG